MNNGASLITDENAYLYVTNNVNLGNVNITAAHSNFIDIRNTTIDLGAKPYLFINGIGDTVRFGEGTKIINSYFDRLALQRQDTSFTLEGEGVSMSVWQCYIGANNASDTTLSIRNGASFSASSIYLGNSATAAGNTLEILDGGTYQTTSSVCLKVGSGNDWASVANTASNGTIRVANGNLIMPAARAGLLVRNASTLQVEGPEANVQVTRLHVIDSSNITFVPPTDGTKPAFPAIQTTEAPLFDATCSILVPEEEALACMKLGGGDYVLLSSAAELTTASLLNTDSLPECVTVRVEANEIILNFANMAPALIMVR